MAFISLDQASRIVDTSLAHGEKLRLKPLTVAVLDAGGHLIAFKRQDRSGILRPEIANGKAWGALGMGSGGRALAARAQIAPALYIALVGTSEGRAIQAPGGVLVRDASGDVIGVVGISGDLPDEARDSRHRGSGVDRGSR